MIISKWKLRLIIQTTKFNEGARLICAKNVDAIAVAKRG